MPWQGATEKMLELRQVLAEKRREFGTQRRVEGRHGATVPTAELGEGWSPEPTRQGALDHSTGRARPMEPAVEGEQAGTTRDFAAFSHVRNEAIIDAEVTADRLKRDQRVLDPFVVEEDLDLLARKEVEVPPELRAVSADGDVVPVPAPAGADAARLGGEGLA